MSNKNFACNMAMCLTVWPVPVVPAIILCLLLSSCATHPVVPVANQPVVETKQTVDVDPSLLQDCPLLTPLPVAPLTQGQVVTVDASFLQDYTLCWHNHHALSDVAKKAWNITPSVAVSK